MKPIYIQRKIPKYSTISYILHYAYINDYPKNAEKFIWGIPSKYSNIKDREISAIVSSFIFDGTRKSVKAAMEIDEMFGGSPYKWMARNEHCNIMMEQNQTKQLYGRITITDIYWLFRELHALYSQYGCIYKLFQASSFDCLQERIERTLALLTPFNGKSAMHISRRNLFFIMMAHCYNDYRIDESQLIAPLYERQISTCASLGLISSKGKILKETLTELTDNLRWFSEKHPITFWIGIFGYIEAVREKDKMLSKLAKTRLTRHRFNKR